MTTEQGTQAAIEDPAAEEEQAQPDPSQGQGSPKELQEYAKAQGQSAKAMRSQLLEARIESLGLDPKTEMGKAIALTYTGDDLSKEALAAYAKETFAFEVKGTDGAPVPANEVVSGSQRQDQLAGQSLPTTPSQAPTEAEQYAAAMLNPDPAQGIDRQTISNSVFSRIGNWLNPPK